MAQICAFQLSHCLNFLGALQSRNVHIKWPALIFFFFQTSLGGAVHAPKYTEPGASFPKAAPSRRPGSVTLDLDKNSQL